MSTNVLRVPDFGTRQKMNKLQKKQKKDTYVPDKCITNEYRNDKSNWPREHDVPS